jgi:hypothetical protein
MTGAPHAPVTGPSVWKPADFADDGSWVCPLTAEQAGQMAAAAEAWRRAGTHYEAIEDPARLLPALLPLVEQVKRDLAGRGFVVLRGLPTAGFSDADCANMFWALGMLFGSGLTQNARGDLVCPVTDTGVIYSHEPGVSTGRAYQSSARLLFHNDPTDVVGLYCVRKAKSGGESAIVSAPAIHNAILAEYPEHLDTLFQGFAYDRKGESWPEEPEASRPIPVFKRRGERLSCRFARSYMNSGAIKAGRPLTEAERAALDCFERTAEREDLVLHMAFEPGDVQLLDNFTVLHGRNRFEDHPEPERRRFLHRLWLRIDEPPWSEEDPIMRNEAVRFGNLGWTRDEWHRIRAERQVA